MLPVRIELTTSALPRMRSTTELRQHEPAGAAGDAALWRKQGSASRRLARPAPIRLDRAMTRKDEERERRLAEALRENLRRRKAQARAAPEDGRGSGEPPAPARPPEP